MDPNQDPDFTAASVHSNHSVFHEQQNVSISPAPSLDTIPKKAQSQRPRTTETQDSGYPKENRPASNASTPSYQLGQFKGVYASDITPSTKARPQPRRIATPRIEEFPDDANVSLSYRSEPTTPSTSTIPSSNTGLVPIPRPSPLNTDILKKMPKLPESPSEIRSSKRFHELLVESPRVVPKKYMSEEVVRRLTWQLRDQIEFLDRQGDDYRRFLEDSKTGIVNELKAQIHQLNENIRVLTEEKIDLNQALAGLRAENSNLNQRNRELKQSLEKEKQNDCSELELVKKMLNEKRTQLVDAEKKRANMVKEVRVLKENAVSDKEKIDDLQQKLHRQHNATQKLRDEKAKMTKEMAQLKEELELAKQQAASSSAQANVPSAQRPTKASAAKQQQKRPAPPKSALKNVSWSPNLENVLQRSEHSDVNIPDDMVWVSTGKLDEGTVDTFKDSDGQLIVRQTLSDRCRVYKAGSIDSKSFKWMHRDEGQIEIDFREDDRFVSIDIHSIKICMFRDGLMMVDYADEGQMYILPDGQRIEVIRNEHGGLERIELFSKEKVIIYDGEETREKPIELNKKKYSKRTGVESKCMYINDGSINFFNKHFECRYSEDKFIRFLSKPHELLFDLHWKTGRIEIQHWHGPDQKRDDCYCNGFPPQRSKN
ncbi:unnamed protein product [Bursaphelenchus xylophilus]|uniref:(pine wood nematode) hypothetical protein n=1 Tax=Bursaphelenchus xylophilus TaxID=6326 RepID=A0A1I7RUC6_BURXY|nr:unnamed protein product [Bursaphelenchus xylophilus]CAG9114032.1 unnamed protein product [Bursaphelenchus xylophilus]